VRRPEEGRRRGGRAQPAESYRERCGSGLGRTFLTSFATALSLIGLLFFGVGTIFDFAFATLFGIVSGTYSTWFIAAPMTIWLEERAAKRRNAPKALACGGASGF
jgi:preprotein translocase subunit SecF